MRFVKESIIRAEPRRVFEFHEQPEALALLTPPWEKARVIEHADISRIGSRAIVETTVFGPIKVRWEALHTVYDPPYLFEDVQTAGPFRNWRHRHIVKPHAAGAVLRDEIEYEPPLGILGRLFAPLIIHKRLEKLFNYRHKITRQWCEKDRMRDEG